jgi:hypothetical protein
LTEISGTGDVGVVEGELSEDAGRALFFGRGKCYTCHAFGSEGSAVRCPNLGVFGDQFVAPVAVRAAQRQADGEGSAVQYLVESLYNPNVSIVEGYPKNLMRPVNRPPTALSDDQITSVVLYLLARSGIDIEEETIAEIRAAQKPFASGAIAVAEGGDEFEFPEGDAEEGRYSFEEMRCLQCHVVEGVTFEGEGEAAENEGGIGPDLTAIGSIQTATYLVAAVLDPNQVIVADPPGQQPGDEGSYRTEFGHSKMPEYHDTMTLRQLLDIAAFMETLQGKAENESVYGE